MKQPAQKTRRPGMLLLLFVLCTVLYYLGEIIDFLGWRALRWDFFYGVHDVHRLIFLAPIMYAGYYFGVRAAVIITTIAINTFLPRAFFISPFPDPLLRTALFTIVAGAVGYLTGRESDRRRSLEARLREQREALLRVLDGATDGVLLVGPDGRIRFANARLVRELGEGTGSTCEDYLKRFGALARSLCAAPLPDRPVWEHTLPDGRTYEVSAVPYVDYDGESCRLVTIRSITR